ncbi:MAG: hypothetical protein U0Z44_16575 [Kouleothrix sp.]
MPAMATAALLSEPAPPYQTIGILVGAVDTASGRRASHETLVLAWRLWLDIGNERDWGKVLLGTVTDARQLRGALALGGICTALPAPTLRYPPARRRAAAAADRADAATDGAQSLMVNQAWRPSPATTCTSRSSPARSPSARPRLIRAMLTMRSTPITAKASPQPAISQSLT